MKDVLYYLSPEDAETVAYWTSDLRPLIERNPFLKGVDLVIEGGVGTGRTMVHMMREAFPQALFVGMDVAEELGGYARPGLYRDIDQKALQRVIQANEHPNMQMEGAMVRASCGDFDLVRNIAKKTGCQVPLLCTFKGLRSLTHRRERNPFERKQSDIEVVTFDKLTSSGNPFVAQIHIPCDEELEAAAKQAGWHTDTFDIGLLMLR